MSEFKIGDRVKVVSEPTPSKTIDVGVMVGMTGTVKELGETYAGVEFDEDIGGHCGDWNGKGGYCWYIIYKHLEKIEETKEEVNEEIKAEAMGKAETMEQKILTVLREEIGVDINEDFDIYENGVNRYTCRFAFNRFLCKVNNKFEESGIWKTLISNFNNYVFKRKPFIPKYGEEYFFLTIDDDDNENILLDVAINTWIGVETDYGRLALGNVFKNEEEALKGRDEILEKLRKLRRGE